MSKFDPVNIKPFNSADEEYSNFYISHEHLDDNVAQNKRSEKLCELQESILQRMNELPGISIIEKTIKDLLDIKFGRLNQQIKDIHLKIGQITSKLDQKQKQSNCKGKLQDHKDLSQKLNGSVSAFHSDIELEDSIQTQRHLSFTNENPMQSQFDSYTEDNDQSIMLVEGVHNYFPIFFDNPHALFRELQEVFIEMDLKFQKCECLYDFHKMKEINFHEKIDKKMNIFLLMELENDELLGAFSHLCFDPQPNYIPKQNPKSFFCNFKKSIFVYASRSNKTHSYDKNYLIFGNWEIKIKAGDQILMTNWGTNGDCFMNKYYGRSEKTNIKLEWMFGVGFENKSIRMKRYCIYQFT